MVHELRADPAVSVLVVHRQEDHFNEGLALELPEADSSDGLAELVLREEGVVLAIEEQFGDVLPGHFG